VCAGFGSVEIGPAAGPPAQAGAVDAASALAVWIALTWPVTMACLLALARRRPPGCSPSTATTS
jgi:hypothetical protein